jgi:hypothetical protein
MGVQHITAAKLREVLHYDPETGVFTWLVNISLKVKAGDIAGSDHGGGYIEIGIFDRSYLAHRLAWLYTHRQLPRKVDHKDGNKKNNRIRNLRKCTSTQNVANRKISKTNKSGFKGVSWSKSNGRWVAFIGVEGKSKYLGGFDTPELAHELYCLAADLLYGEFANHGTHKCASQST